MKKNAFFSVALALLALLALPKPAPASQQSGIWIHNDTGNCLWATVYSAGRIDGRPNWVPAKDKRVYGVSWKGVGQQFRVRVEILSTTACTPQSSAHPLVADIDTYVQGSLAYQVRVVGQGHSFRIIRY
jgi:hypothetical protein